MKNFVNICSLAAFAALASACTSDPDEPVRPDETRTLTVNSALTRTTIDYEGSDFSHLVWSEGDQVAYVTDAAGETFRTAPVTRNRFTAEIPAGATEENTLTVIWPCAGLEGQPLNSATAQLAGAITQQADAPFDGNLLPMYASVRIPATGNTVDAEYRVLGSVVRFTVDATGHETETLRSITLKAKEPLVGKYTYAAGQWSFEGTSDTVVATVTGEKALLDNKFHVYMVVNPALYTGVDVSIETDVDTYVFPGGTMDLAQEGRTLYRIDVALSERPEPVIPYFTQVTDIADLTLEGSYLIVAERAAGDYVMAGGRNFQSLVDPVPVNYTADGVEKTDEVMKYVWQIVRDDATGHFSLYTTKTKKFIGSPGAIYANDYGKFFSADEIPQTDDGKVTYYWDITVDADRAVVKSLRMENVFFQWNNNYNVQYFCCCKPDTDGWKDIMILKLRE